MKRLVEDIIKKLTNDELNICISDFQTLNKTGNLPEGFTSNLFLKIVKETGINYRFNYIEGKIKHEIDQRNNRNNDIPITKEKRSIEDVIQKLTQEELDKCYFDFKELNTTGILPNGFTKILITKIEKEILMDYGVAHIEKEILRETARRHYENKDKVMVVYAHEPDVSGVWVYGVFTDELKGFNKMEEMNKSDEYGHLMWSDRIVVVDSELNILSKKVKKDETT